MMKRMRQIPAWASSKYPPLFYVAGSLKADYSRKLSNNFPTNVLQWSGYCEISYLRKVEETFCLH